MNWGLIFRHFLKAVIAARYKLALLLILISILLGIYLFLERPSYKTSWVMLLPGTDRSTTLDLDNLGESRISGANAYGSVSISPKNTYREIALSDAVINSAAKEYGVEPAAFSKPRISLIDQTPAMQFTLKGESQEELIYRAKLYNDTFHRTLDELRENEIERTFEGVESNLADAKTRLNEARQKIVEYQISSDVVTDEQFKRWLNDSEQFRTDQTNAQIKLAQLQATINSTLEQLSISKQQAKALLFIHSNPAIQSLLKTLSTRLAEQVSNNARYAAENPLRKELDAEVAALIGTLRSNLAQQPGLSEIADSEFYAPLSEDAMPAMIRTMGGDLAQQPSLSEIASSEFYALLSQDAMPAIQNINSQIAEYEGIQAQTMALTASLQNYQQRIKTHTAAAARLADLQRDHQIAEAIFSSALAKLDTSKLDIYATYPLTQLLTQPGGTIVRDRLQTKLMIVAAFLIYGLLSLALVISQVRDRLTQQQRTSRNKRTSRDKRTSRTTSSDNISCSSSESPVFAHA